MLISVSFSSLGVSVVIGVFVVAKYENHEPNLIGVSVVDAICFSHGVLQE